MVILELVDFDGQLLLGLLNERYKLGECIS